MADAHIEDERGEVLEVDSIEETCVDCRRDDIRVNGQEVIDGNGVAERFADGSIRCLDCWHAGRARGRGRSNAKELGPTLIEYMGVDL